MLQSMGWHRDTTKGLNNRSRVGKGKEGWTKLTWRCSDLCPSSPCLDHHPSPILAESHFLSFCLHSLHAGNRDRVILANQSQFLIKIVSSSSTICKDLQRM